MGARSRSAGCSGPALRTLTAIDRVANFCWAYSVTEHMKQWHFLCMLLSRYHRYILRILTDPLARSPLMQLLKYLYKEEPWSVSSWVYVTRRRGEGQLTAGKQPHHVPRLAHGCTSSKFVRVTINTSFVSVRCIVVIEQFSVTIVTILSSVNTLREQKL